jgi:hypothetical protein
MNNSTSKWRKKNITIEKPICYKKDNHICNNKICHHFMDSGIMDSKLSASILVYSSDKEAILNKANELNLSLKDSFLSNYVTNTNGGDTAALMIPVMCQSIRQSGKFDIVKFRRDLLKAVVSYLDASGFTKDCYPHIMEIVNKVMKVSFKLPPTLVLYGNVSGSPVWNPSSSDIEHIGKYSCIIAKKKSDLSDLGIAPYIMNLCETMKWNGGFLMQIMTPRSIAVNWQRKYHIFNDIIVNVTANGKARFEEIACTERSCNCLRGDKKIYLCSFGFDIESMKMAALRELKEETNLILKDESNINCVEHLGCWGNNDTTKCRFYSLDIKYLK